VPDVQLPLISVSALPLFATDPEHRSDYINGLRQLADYLDANPGVPVPKYGTSITVLADLADDGGIRQVEDIAAQLAAPVITDLDLGRYAASRTFGPVGYEAVSHTRAVMAAYHALSSYDGCVTPDD
jgi:hypothetical protein